MNTDGTLDRNLALEVVRVTEAAALACSQWMGRGDETAADQAAVDAMRDALHDALTRPDLVALGEAARDKVRAFSASNMAESFRRAVQSVRP